ncbi:MAG: hypothetical protein BWY68_00372 [bacterium ADurb.Bin400]|nr:MAG: hypothetical protein BWY68_00372 [bacterium ADurb.Bin400]
MDVGAVQAPIAPADQVKDRLMTDIGQALDTFRRNIDRLPISREQKAGAIFSASVEAKRFLDRVHDEEFSQNRFFLVNEAVEA